MNTPLPPLVRCARLLAALACISSTSFASLVYYLPFDNGTTATLANEGTVGGTATTSGAVSAVTTPLHSPLGGSHAESIGINNTAIITPPNSTDKFRLDTAGQQMTLSTWVYQNSVSQNWSFNVNTAATGTGWQLAITNTGAVRVQYAYINGSGGTSSASFSSTATIPLTTWTHLAMTFTAGSGFTVYANGTAIITSSVTGLGSTIITNSNAIQFRSTSIANIIDDAAMWDTALTAAEISAISKAPAAITGYDVGVLDPLFTLHRTAGASTITEGGIGWTYATGFDVTGKTLGDVWTVGDESYMWLGGTSSANSTGLLGTLSQIPEPASSAIFGGFAVIALAAARRKSRKA
jgi:hypothetical protein